jgi:hypothetical protein
MKTLTLILLLTCLSARAQTNTNAWHAGNIPLWNQIAPNTSGLIWNFDFFFNPNFLTPDMVFQIYTAPAITGPFNLYSNLPAALEPNSYGLYHVDFQFTNYQFWNVFASNSFGISSLWQPIGTPPPPVRRRWFSMTNNIPGIQTNNYGTNTQSGGPTVP